MIITTSPDPSKALRNRANRLAERYSFTFVERRRQTIEGLLMQSKQLIVFIVTEKELRLYQQNSAKKNTPFIYHPSMANIKLKAMLKGQQEQLITFSGCETGDRVLDCTAGLATDSLLFSMQVGEAGKVVALESQLPLYVLVSEGLQHYPSNVPEIEQTMRRIQLKHAMHDEYLVGLPDKSFDIVYFDPMFREPIHDSEALKPLRMVANHNPITLETIDEAKRVARKCIILKEHASSPEFERLGFMPVGKHQGKKPAYGIIKL